MAAPPDIPALARKLRAGDRATLARAITLVESRRADHQQTAHRLVQELLPETGKATRIGITGSPGVGKSTTIDALGTYLTGKGHKVAVLAVDPSSTRTGGSIRGENARDHADLRGGGLRRDFGRDRRNRAVRDRRLRHDRLLPRADAAGGR